MAAAAPARHPRAMSEHITHQPTIRRLERSSSDRMFAGVAGGLGRYFEFSPTFFRVGFIVLTLIGGAGILIYLAAWLVMPKEGEERSYVEQAVADRRRRPWPLVGIALAGVALLILLSHAAFSPAAGGGWLLVLVAGLIVFWASRSDRRAVRVARVIGALLALAVAAAIAAVVLAFSWFNVSLDDGVGNRVYTPAAATAVKGDYRLGIGNLRVDLSQIGAVHRPLHVDAHVGIGELRVIVPANVPIAVDAHAKAGDVFVLRHEDSGRNASVHTGSGLLTIDASVGGGRIDVVRAG